MGEAEMQALWQAQANDRVEGLDPEAWVRREHRRHGRTVFATWVAGAIAAAALLLKLSLLGQEGGFTLGNGWLEILLAGVPLACVGMTARQLRRNRRELESLNLDMASCLDHFLHRTRSEIAETRRVAPLVLGAILVLFAAAKWQSLASGREAWTNEIATIVFVAGLIAAAGAFLYHRLNATLRPRLEYLRSLRRQLEPGE